MAVSVRIVVIWVVIPWSLL